MQNMNQAHENGNSSPDSSQVKISSYPLLDLECVAQKACALIDLFQTKLADLQKDKIGRVDSPDFDEAASSAVCGYDHFADQVKKELLEVINRIFEESRARKALQAN